MSSSSNQYHLKVSEQKVQAAPSSSHQHHVEVAEHDLYSIGKYLYERIPNWEETFTTSAYKSVIEAALVPEALLNNPNPTIKSFVRDIMKLPSILTAYYYGYRFGGTKYVYDEYLVAAAIFKPVCKVSFMMASSGYFGVETSGRIANYLCETPSRALTTISRKWQDLQQESPETLEGQTKGSFFLDSMTADLVWESTLSAIIKTVTTDMLGKSYGKHIGIEYTAEDGSIKKEHAVEYWIHDYKLLDALPAMGQSTIIQFCKGLVDTYVLTPPARIVEDIPHAVRHVGFVNDAQEFVQESYALAQDWWYGIDNNSTEVAGKTEL